MKYLIAVCVWFIFMVHTNVHAADFFVEGGVGMSQFQRTVPDGTWVQEGFPHRFKWQDYAYRAGLGAKLTPEWSLGANYINLGTVQSETLFVADHDYDPINHLCVTNCATPGKLKVYDTLRGIELIGTYMPWQLTIAPFIRIGMAGFQHSLHYDNTTYTGQTYGVDLKGVVLAGVVGGGACYHEWLCADISYYKGISTSQFPVSTGVIVPMVSIKIPF